MDRRQWVATSVSAAMACCSHKTLANLVSASGMVVGQVTAEKVGMRVLEQGGNAMDAVVAAALVSAIAAPSSTGIGGYGMSAVVAYDGGTKLIAVDANTMAPKAIPKDMFLPNPARNLPHGINAKDNGLSVGWHSAGVPGILAGLQLIIDRFCTRKLDELMAPAITLARDGIVWPKNLANAVQNSKMLQSDTGSRNLYLPKGHPIPEGGLFKNPDLADMLSQLAKQNSVRSFYQGDIALRIAEAFQKNDGLVTSNDLAEYEAYWVEPYSVEIGPCRLYTAPLTAGGISTLQMLRTLQAMDWNKLGSPSEKWHARIEAMRIAWRDRLEHLGDPNHSEQPIERFLSREYAAKSSEEVLRLVKSKALSFHPANPSHQTGTIHLNACDHQGNCVALTLTHGNGFGACVTVDGLGLTLGHGMSRFDARPDHPNGPAPRKRPLHNMVPTIVTRDGKAWIVAGGTGGRKIPNGLFDVLTSVIFQGKSIAEAIDGPRINTDGGSSISLDRKWDETSIQSLRSLGYNVKTEGAATMHAVAYVDGVAIKASR